MHYFYCSVSVIVVLYAFGLGFTILVLPESLRRYTLILAPWVGYCYIGLACWPFFYYERQIDRQTAGIILIPPLLCLVIELIRKRRLKLVRTLAHLPTLGALGIAAAGFAVLSIPIWKTGHLTTVSLGNNDIATYAAVARYLSEFTRHSMEGFIGQLAVGPNPFERVTKDYYFGSPALIAVVGKLLGLMPHQHTSLCAFLIFALGTAATFLLLHETLQLPTISALLGVAFVSFHPMIQFVVLEGFFAQVAGAGLAILMFWANTKLFDRNITRSDQFRVWVLLVLFTCGLLLNYSHMLVFVWFFVALYAIVLAFLEKSLYEIKVCGVANVLAIVATALICPQRVGPFLEVFKTYAAAEVGWFITWMAPDYVAGLMYKNPFFGIMRVWRLHLTLGILVTLLFVGTMFIAHRNGFRRIVALGVTCVAVYSGCFLLAIMGQKAGVLGGYKSFKLVSFFLPFFAVALIALWAVAKSGYRTIDLFIKSVAVAAVIIGYAMADKVMLRQSRFLTVEPEYESLVGLEHTQSVKSINVLSGAFWPTMWTAYFLMHKKLYLANQSYYVTSEPVGEYDLEDNTNSLSRVVQVKPIEKAAVTQLNERFTLVGPQTSKVRAKLDAGWFFGEVGYIWTGKDGKRASIILHSQNDGVKVRLKLICAPLRANDSLTLQSHGERLAATINAQPNGHEEINMPELVLNKGDNEVDIMSELDPARPSKLDPRLLSHCFSLVEVDEL